MVSPTVHLESLLMTWTIDAYKGRDAGSVDIAGAFLLSDIVDFVLVKLTGDAVNVMCEGNPSYSKYVTKERGKLMLYMKLRKALYGIMQGEILWYETFTTCLKKNGFKLNAYGPCISNKVINGKQCVIFSHVDDNKISHDDPSVVTKVINMLRYRFGEVAMTRRKKHTFVGMDVEMKKRDIGNVHGRVSKGKHRGVRKENNKKSSYTCR